MTAKQKAEELLLKYLKVKTHKMFNGWWHKITAKQCALISVDELIDFAKLTDATNGWDHLNYWQEVKKEIELL